MNWKRLTPLASLTALLLIGCSPSETDVVDEAASAATAADCSFCHAAPPSTTSTGALHPASTMSQCVTCHRATVVANGDLIDPANHPDGAVEVSCGGCHGNPPPAPHPANSNCTSCHGTFTTPHPNGKLNLLSSSCRSCHGVPPDSGLHDRHSRVSCSRCHSGFSSTTINVSEHMNGSTRVSVRCHCGGWGSSGGSSGGWGGSSGGSSGGRGGR
jgi:hypothetical protein